MGVLIYYKGMNELEDDIIFWCNRCKSLSILESESTLKEFGDVSYCKDCGCTEIVSGTYDDWESLYREEQLKKNINYGNRNFDSELIKARERKEKKEKEDIMFSKNGLLKYYIK